MNIDNVINVIAMSLDTSQEVAMCLVFGAVCFVLFSIVAALGGDE